MSKFRWVNDNVVIDFAVPKSMQELFDEAEQLDLAGSLEYDCVADILDVLGKNMYGAGKITQEQWDMICE